jgi:hypothetical protein
MDHGVSGAIPTSTAMAHESAMRRGDRQFSTEPVRLGIGPTYGLDERIGGGSPAREGNAPDTGIRHTASAASRRDPCPGADRIDITASIRSYGIHPIAVGSLHTVNGAIAIRSRTTGRTSPAP